MGNWFKKAIQTVTKPVEKAVKAVAKPVLTNIPVVGNSAYNIASGAMKPKDWIYGGPMGAAIKAGVTDTKLGQNMMQSAATPKNWLYGGPLGVTAIGLSNTMKKQPKQPQYGQPTTQQYDTSGVQQSAQDNWARIFQQMQGMGGYGMGGYGQYQAQPQWWERPAMQSPQSYRGYY